MCDVNAKHTIVAMLNDEVLLKSKKKIDQTVIMNKQALSKTIAKKYAPWPQKCDNDHPKPLANDHLDGPASCK